MAGAILGAAGAALALACIVTFVFVGKGTPAPFDPPRRLVMRGPYRLVRNPMYIGATLALAGAALFYRSLSLLSYAAVFLLVTHGFVVLYEEPTLQSDLRRATTRPTAAKRAGGGRDGGRERHEPPAPWQGAANRDIIAPPLVTPGTAPTFFACASAITPRNADRAG